MVIGTMWCVYGVYVQSMWVVYGVVIQTQRLRLIRHVCLVFFQIHKIVGELTKIFLPEKVLKIDHFSG